MFSCDSQWLLGYVDRVSVIFMLISIYNGSCMGVIIGMLLAFYIYNILFVFFPSASSVAIFCPVYIHVYTCGNNCKNSGNACTGVLLNLRT